MLLVINNLEKFISTSQLNIDNFTLIFIVKFEKTLWITSSEILTIIKALWFQYCYRFVHYRNCDKIFFIQFHYKYSHTFSVIERVYSWQKKISVLTKRWWELNLWLIFYMPDDWNNFAENSFWLYTFQFFFSSSNAHTLRAMNCRMWLYLIWFLFLCFCVSC